MAKRSKKAEAGGTPATVALLAAEVPFSVHHYDVDPDAASKGMAVAEALGVDPTVVHKTLLARVDGRLVVAVVPVAAQLDLKALSSAAGGRKAAMAEVADAERATGYVVGGISPLGQRNAHDTFIDEGVIVLERIIVSAGRRGMQIELAPDDLIELTGAQLAALAK